LKIPFSLKLAWREGRSSIRQIGVYMASITLGVGALVAIHSFRDDVTRSVQEEARSLLGADLRLSKGSAYPDSLVAIVDSIAGLGADVAEVTDMVSMVFAPSSEATRLLQVRALEGGFPFYGDVTTSPAGEWERLGHDGTALVDEAVLIQLDIDIGDTVAVGRSRFVVAGTVAGLPTDIGFQAAVGPRIYFPLSELEATGLLTFGSLAQYQFYLRLPVEVDAEEIEDGYRSLFRSESVRSTTAADQAENLTEATQVLSRFLGLIGLAALLLGGIGVASAIHVYVKEKLTSVAVLRCIGARQRTVFLAYLLQAGLLGAAGAAAGVVLGLGAQRLLPLLITDVLPVTVSPSINFGAAGAGMLLGVWVAVIFALIPMLAVRDVAPLAALRRGFEPERRRTSPSRLLAYAALMASILLLSVMEAPTPGLGLGFAAALGATLFLLWLAARGMMAMTRRLFPRRAAYPIRQGVANLYRPHNQTVAVTLALGFGVFLIGSIYLLQGSLRNQLAFDEGVEQPNMVLFDLQPQQLDGVLGLVEEAADSDPLVVPIITAEIAAINGVSTADLIADTTEGGPARWALRRTYRNTYRADLKDSEILAAGEWWDPSEPEADMEPEAETALPRISLEDSQARSLAVEIGDRITWDVQGRDIETQVANLRTVDWARFEPNFYVVFEPGSLETAPQTLLAFTRVVDPDRRALLQRDVVRAFPNVSILDVALIQEALDTILGKVNRAIRFLAVFAGIGGVLVLIGALATSRFQRMRESALLKTLGAQRRQILQILFTEYLSLGVLSGLAGLLLGTLSAWALVHFVFEASFRPSLAPLLGLWIAVTTLTVAVGLAGSRSVLRRTPLATLREGAE